VGKVGSTEGHSPNAAARERGCREGKMRGTKCFIPEGREGGRELFCGKGGEKSFTIWKNHKQDEKIHLSQIGNTTPFTLVKNRRKELRTQTTKGHAVEKSSEEGR